MTGWPDEAYAAGMQDGTLCPHTSRTLMLAELRTLLGACPSTSDRASYRTAIVENNVLLKPTMVTRKKSFEMLAQLYGLSPTVVIFRALRDLWDEAGESGQPLLALLCGLARDPSFRATAPVVLDSSPGDAIAPVDLADAIERQYPGRFNPTTVIATGQHAASSWQQSGHLRGHVRKVRARAISTPASTVYALLLGHLIGARGDGLFATDWARALDATEHVTREHAAAAARRGWLEYRASAGVTEITFRHLLRPLNADLGGTPV